MTQLNSHTNGRHAPSAALIALLTYSINDIAFALLPDGSLLIDGAQLTQQQLFSLSVCIGLPGFRAAINRIERLRQAALVARLVEDDQRVR